MHTWPDLNVVGEYWLDAWQRSVLFLDTLRQRGNIYNDHNAKEIPHVLHFESELVLDGHPRRQAARVGTPSTYVTGRSRLGAGATRY